MTRLSEAFARAAQQNKTALVSYFCAGDPDPETTVAAVLAAVEEGSDVIELGVPFSDPTADGIAIQRASERALKKGMSMRKTLEVARAIRARSQVPIVLFGYYNPILAYGEEALCRDAAAAGVDALLVVDLPPEECGSLHAHARREGMALVPLLAPTSSPARIERAAGVADSFLYYVSVTGVTGAAGANFAAAAERAQQIKQDTKKPVVIGFGVSSGKDVAQLARYADGVVVGSALVRAIEAGETREAAVENVRELVRDLVRGTER